MEKLSGTIAEIPKEIFLNFMISDLTDREMIRIFNNEILKKIYCCVRSWHLVDQHFCTEILNLAPKVYKCRHLKEFLDVTYYTFYFQRYGSKYFWEQVWDIIRNKRELRILPLNCKKISFISR